MAKDQYEILKKEVPELVKELKVISSKIDEMSKKVYELGSGWTPGTVIQ